VSGQRVGVAEELHGVDADAEAILTGQAHGEVDAARAQPDVTLRAKTAGTECGLERLGDALAGAPRPTWGTGAGGHAAPAAQLRGGGEEARDLETLGAALAVGAGVGLDERQVRLEQLRADVLGPGDVELARFDGAHDVEAEARARHGHVETPLAALGAEGA